MSMPAVLRVDVPTNTRQVKIELPSDAQVISTCVTNGRPGLVFRGSRDAAVEVRSFVFVAEGEEIPLGADYIGIVVGGRMGARGRVQQSVVAVFELPALRGKGAEP